MQGFCLLTFLCTRTILKPTKFGKFTGIVGVLAIGKAKELRSGDMVGETLTLKSFEPVLLEVSEKDMTDSYSYICSDYTDVTIQIKESLLQTEGDLKAILAVYKDGRLLGADLEPAAKTTELYVPYSVKNTDGITVNVMLWDMKTMASVTEEIAIAGGI